MNEEISYRPQLQMCLFLLYSSEFYHRTHFFSQSQVAIWRTTVFDTSQKTQCLLGARLQLTCVHLIQWLCFLTFK